MIAQTGLQFDLATPQGKLIATLMAGLAEFERDLLRERVRSGVTAAQARGVVFGRRLGLSSLVVFLSLQRYFVRGLLAGGLKG